MYYVVAKIDDRECRYGPFPAIFDARRLAAKVIGDGNGAHVENEDGEDVSL